MADNFSFLKSKFPILAKFGSLAEQYLYSDANSCLIKLRMLGETVVNLIFGYEKMSVDPELNAAKRINLLHDDGVLEDDFADILHILRKKGNQAAHENYDSEHDAEICLRMAYRLSEWFMQVYGDWQYQNKPFILPTAQPQPAPLQAAAETPTQEEKLLTEQAAKQAEEAPVIAKEERRKQSHEAAAKSKKSEEETRYIIDQKLRMAGWEVDSKEITYAKGYRPEKGHNYIISEWPTDSSVYQNGYADYAQFIGTKLVGIIEAKAEHKDIPSALDGQAKEYASHIKDCDQQYVVGTYGKYKVPFVYATNGRPHIEQFKIKSGIWFQDLRKPDNAPCALKGWYSPEGVEAMLGRDIEEKNKALVTMQKDFLTDPDGLNLRPYQLQAVEAAEKAILAGQRSVLLAMATGTGKTRLVLALLYRFLKSERFRRILFVVDRNTLGVQAMDTFKNVRLEELLPLTDIYDVKDLEDKTFDKDTKVHVATVQGLVKRLLFNEDGPVPTVSDYDLVIVDEAHRGYILDKEMSDAEQLYRNQADYQSKYRQVIEYFDAVKIGLTATPALQTTEIFGKPVYTYSYREAVIDGWLIDHDAPYTMETVLKEKGIHYKKGDKIKAILLSKDGKIDTAYLDDDMDFDVDDFNRQVITESFNRVVLQEISKDIDPEYREQGKTLIYAVNDMHADLIVSILKEIYAEKGVDTDAILKITGSSFGGNRKKIEEAIRNFKNELFPSVVVTVDLLTTGIDVPSITTLIFLRRVKSRILFEQMLGRATRQCPEIHKEYFRIYDPVGTYSTLEPVTDMKPVVVNVSVTFAELLAGLEILTDDADVDRQVNQIIAKLQRKKRRMTDVQIKDFCEAAKITGIDAFVETVRAAKSQEAKALLLDRKEAFIALDSLSGGYGGNKEPIIVISETPDKVTDTGRGYGDSAQRPEDYLEAFTSFIKSHINEVTALNILCSRPADLTRADLKSLRKELAKQGYSEKELNTAYNEVLKKHNETNAEITADIISIVRKAAIGSALISKEDRIHNAIAKLKQKHYFTKQEENWLNRIENYLLNESVLNMDTFNEDSRFRAAGGFNKANKVFGNKLEAIVKEINTYLYDDGGQTA